LTAFARGEGHSRVPQDHVEGGVNLGHWVATQRLKKDSLGLERVSQLEAVPGWAWDARVDTFPRKLALLKAYAEREGHARVPQSHVEERVSLGTWVATQRKNRGSIEPECRAELEAVAGWTWDPFADAFNASLECLQSYAQREGHVRVPRSHTEGDIKLGSWVSKQRHKKDKLSVDRRRQLEALPGWTWSKG
jgi:hypothetical protein